MRSQIQEPGAAPLDSDNQPPLATRIGFALLAITIVLICQTPLAVMAARVMS